MIETVTVNSALAKRRMTLWSLLPPSTREPMTMPKPWSNASTKCVKSSPLCEPSESMMTIASPVQLRKPW